MNRMEKHLQQRSRGEAVFFIDRNLNTSNSSNTLMKHFYDRSCQFYHFLVLNYFLLLYKSIKCYRVMPVEKIFSSLHNIFYLAKYQISNNKLVAVFCFMRHAKLLVQSL